MIKTLPEIPFAFAAGGNFTFSPKYLGIPPGPIAMPDISSIDAVLNYEHHNYYYFVADITNFGYHNFAINLAQHNRNKKEYVRWISKQKVVR